MESATQETPALANLPSPFQPADLDAHEADKIRRAAEREKKKPLLNRCLDPEFASQAEARKPLYEWEVEATYTRKNEKGRMEERNPKEKILAQTEQDAWALFCDKLGDRIGPHEGTHSIEQLKKVN
jgi:hypothetical protein